MFWTDWLGLSFKTQWLANLPYWLIHDGFLKAEYRYDLAVQ